MSDVVDFLRARLDEDERRAKVQTTSWSADLGARALREVEAKRRILEQHDAWPVLVECPPEFEQHSDPSDLQGITFRMSQQMAWLTTREYVARFGVEAPTTATLRALASIYADHPDYRQEWAL